jgi:predicted DNA-binding transcriptional regulator AlpA
MDSEVTLRRPDVALALDKSERSFIRLLELKEFPAAALKDGKADLWPASAVKSWLEQQHIAAQTRLASVVQTKLESSLRSVATFQEQSKQLVDDIRSLQKQAQETSAGFDALKTAGVEIERFTADMRQQSADIAQSQADVAGRGDAANA